MTLRMMILVPVSLFAVGLLARSAFADDTRQPFGYRIGQVTSVNDHCCWSLDNYCRKPMPPVPCPAAGCHPDCYARKTPPPLPCVGGCVTADNYPRKCPPRPPGQCATPGLPRNILTTSGEPRLPVPRNYGFR